MQQSPSQRINNTKTHATFDVAGISIKGSSPVTIGSRASVSLQDNYKVVNPKALQGAWGERH